MPDGPNSPALLPAVTADGPAGNGFQDALLLASPGLPGADALADDQAAAAMQLPLRARSASLGHSMQSAHSASMLAHSLPSSSMPMAVLGGAAGSSLGHSGNRLGPLAQSLDARDPGAFELDQALQAARRAEQARLAVAELAAAGLGLGSSWLLGPEAALALAGGGGGGGVPRVMSMPASMYSISEQGEDGGCRWVGWKFCLGGGGAGGGESWTCWPGEWIACAGSALRTPCTP